MAARAALSALDEPVHVVRWTGVPARSGRYGSRGLIIMGLPVQGVLPGGPEH